MFHADYVGEDDNMQVRIIAGAIVAVVVLLVIIIIMTAFSSLIFSMVLIVQLSLFLSLSSAKKSLQY